MDQLVYGTVVHDPQAPNIAREVGLSTLPPNVPAVTVSRACASANQAISDGVNLIESGNADVVVAGGAECLSRIPILVSDRLSRTLVAASRAKTLGARIRTFARTRPRDLVPVAPAIAEYSTGETMGQAAERMAKENGISREDQDRWALGSHRKAHAGTEDGRITAEIAPLYVPPKYETTVEKDNGIRPDTSMEALSALRPVFDREFGSVTAGNSSPLTDGASAVLLMSPGRAKGSRHGTAGAYVRAYAITALDPAAQLLQGPAYAAPLALDRAGLTMADIDLLEMHEAFAAQVLSNLQAWDSDRFCREELGRAGKLGHPDPEADQRDGRLDRHRPPLRRHRRPPDDDAPQRTAPTGRSVRTDHRVRGRAGWGSRWCWSGGRQATVPQQGLSDVATLPRLPAPSLGKVHQADAFGSAVKSDLPTIGGPRAEWRLTERQVGRAAPVRVHHVERPIVSVPA